MLGRLLRSGGSGSGFAQLGFADYLRLYEQFGYNGVGYMLPTGGLSTMNATQAGRNPIALRCMVIRGSVFSQIDFKFRNEQTKKLYGTPALQLLENPWPGAGSDEFLMRTEFDNSRYGNSYWYIEPASRQRPFGSLVWCDPTKVDIITGDVGGPSGKTVGKNLLAYHYKDKAGEAPEIMLPNEIVHVRTIPDPTHPFRGLSWLSSLLPDLVADQDLSDFKHAFVNNAATPNLVVTFPAGSDGKSSIGREAFNKFREKMEATHTGPQAAFKTLYIGGGADVKSVGSNFEQMQLTQTQQHGETRLCLAAGVPASIVGVAEGLKGSTLNTANYAATRRSFADITIRPLWKTTCKALETAVPPPAGSRLWYDASEVLFLKADLQDAAAEKQSNAVTMLTLINAGYDPDTVTEFVATGDYDALSHTGLVSVQLQAPGKSPIMPKLNQEDDPNDTGE